MVTIYKSSIDGKEFTSKTACRNYEKEIVLSDDNIENEIIFFDENGQQINFFEGIKEFDDKVWYIWAKTNEAISKLEALIDEEECCLYGLGEKGFYFFYLVNLRWYTTEEYEDVYKKAKRIKNKIQREIVR